MNETQDFLARYCTTDSSELYHHGILGQKWGVRRYQNPDGSLTEEGRKRYLTDSGELNKKGVKRFIDRGDGTYHDVTKYSRKLGLLGGIIDSYRLMKENKKIKNIVDSGQNISLNSLIGGAAATSAAQIHNQNVPQQNHQLFIDMSMHNAQQFINQATVQSAMNNMYIASSPPLCF